MGTERIFCTVIGDFTQIAISGKGEIERITLPVPCVGCKKRSSQDSENLISALSDGYLLNIKPTGSINVIVVPLEDNPAVPDVVKIGEPIVLSCSYGFES